MCLIDCETQIKVNHTVSQISSSFSHSPSLLVCIAFAFVLSSLFRHFSFSDPTLYLSPNERSCTDSNLFFHDVFGDEQRNGGIASEIWFESYGEFFCPTPYNRPFLFRLASWQRREKARGRKIEGEGKRWMRG